MQLVLASKTLLLCSKYVAGISSSFSDQFLQLLPIYSYQCNVSFFIILVERYKYSQPPLFSPHSRIEIQKVTFDPPGPPSSLLTTYEISRHSHAPANKQSNHGRNRTPPPSPRTGIFVTGGALMDGRRKDATHSTIWLMPRPLLMNYAKLCPRERSHMFIMKAAGVLDVPRVAPNELRVTGQHDTQ